MERQSPDTKSKKIALRYTAYFFLSAIVLLSLILYLPSIIAGLNSAQTGSPKKILGPGQQAASVIGPLLSKDYISFDKDVINILALGRPGAGYSGGNLTDTILIANINIKEKKAVMISLPRDFLVADPKTNYITKINALYSQSGMSALKSKVEDITGLTIDYYAMIDLVVAKELIELVDGLNIYVPQDIHDPYYPGPNYSYQTFDLKAGWRYLAGDEALKYIRTRYTSPNGDFDRMARQQQVLELLKQKVLGMNLLWDFPTYLKMLNSLSNHIDTDLELAELKSLYNLSQQININDMKNIVIDKKETGLLLGGLVPFGSQMASVAYPKAGRYDYSEIQKYIKEYLD